MVGVGPWWAGVEPRVRVRVRVRVRAWVGSWWVGRVKGKGQGEA